MGGHNPTLPSSQTSANSDLSQALTWARLFRTAEEQGLSEHFRNDIRQAVLEFLENLTTDTPKGQISIETSPKLADAQNTAPKVLPPQLTDENVLELKLRQMIDGGALWIDYKQLVFKLLRLTKNPSMAARCCELAVLNSDLAEIEEVLEIANSRFIETYRNIHPAIRGQLVQKFFKDRSSDVLDKIIFMQKEQDYLTPCERLYIFLSMNESSDQASSYIYFKRHRDSLFSAVKSSQEKMGVNDSSFLLTVGKLALSLGYIQDARDLFSKIEVHGVDYDTALRLLLDVAIEKNIQGLNEYIDRLTKADGLNQRLTLLQEFMTTTRRLGGFRDQNRPALNDILRTPLTWIGDSAEAWVKTSELLVENRDLEPLLPNLFAVFRDNALRWHPPLIDLALWEGPRTLNSDHPRDRYWKGIALLHHYMATGPTAEESLWDAREYIEQGRRDWHKASLSSTGNTLIPLPYDWRDLHKATYSYAAKNNLYLEIDRTRILEQLRVIQNEQMVTISDIENYMSHSPTYGNTRIYGPVYSHLIKIAQDRKSRPLELRLLIRRAQAMHLTNYDVNRVWQIAIEDQDSDLAWRVATIAKARSVLCKQVRHAWEISGEKRTNYPIAKAESTMGLKAVRDLGPQTSRMVHSLMVVGHLIPELLAAVDSHSLASRSKGYPPSSIEARMEKSLQGLSWLSRVHKIYQYSDGHSTNEGQIPPFAHILPANPWTTLVTRIGHSLGLYAWGWRLKTLGEKIVDLIPKMAHRQDLKRQSNQVAKWLRDLTPEQRTAWQDLASLARIMDDESAMEALAMSVCRLATLIIQSHHLALTSLIAMRAKASILWDLETFIISPTYTEQRSQLGTKTRIMVPTALLSLTNIIETSHNEQQAM